LLKEKALACEAIEFTGGQTAKQCPGQTITAIYQAPWQVEMFFKWIKQNLNIKSFIGVSKNAVMTQIRIALCVYLMLAFIKFQSKLETSLQQIRRLLQLNLFEKRDLMDLLVELPLLIPPNRPQQRVLF